MARQFSDSSTDEALIQATMDDESLHLQIVDANRQCGPCSLDTWDNIFGHAYLPDGNHASNLS